MTSSTDVPTTDRDGEPRPSILRSSAWNSLTQVAPALSAIVMTPYVIAGLGPDRYGMYVLSISLLSFLGSFDGGLTASAGRFFSIYAGTGDAARGTRLLVTLLAAVTVGGLLAAGLVGVLAPYLVTVFHVPADVAAEGTFLIRVMAFVTVGWLLYSVLSAMVNAHGRFAWTSLAYVAGYGVLMAGMTIVLVRGDGLHAVAWVLLAQSATCVLLTAPAVARHLRGSPLRLLSWAELREYAGFAWKVQIQGLAGLVNSQAAALISAAVVRVREVGVFTVGANYALNLRFVPVNGLRPIQAQLGHDFGRHGWEARTTFERLQRAWVQAVTGWTAMALGSAWFAVHAWLGPDFSRAGVVSTILVLGNFCWLGSGVLLAWLNVTGYPSVEARYAVFSVLLNLALMVVFVHVWGILGTAVAVATTQLVATGYLLHRALVTLPEPFPLFVREIPWLPALATVGLTVLLELAARPVLPSGGPGLLLAAAVSVPAGAVYCLLVYGRARCLAVARTTGRRAAALAGQTLRSRRAP